MPRLEHKVVGEFHVYTSPDVPGLYVADRDAELALSRVQPTIEALQRMAARKKREQELLAQTAAE